MDILINTYDTMAKILLVEDEVNIASFIERGLREFGHEVYVAYDGAAGWELTQKNDFQLLILDIIMPKMNGLQLCKQYRQRFGYHAPVIMLTALGTTEDIVSGLDAGADDYLVKPFGMMEMVSRVKAVLRRCKKAEKVVQLKAGGIVLNTEERTVFLDEERIELTYKEFELLRLFLEKPGIVHSREQLFLRVWGESFVGETRTLDMHIRTLRQKLGAYGDMIETVRGVGYRLEEKL